MQKFVIVPKIAILGILVMLTLFMTVPILAQTDDPISDKPGNEGSRPSNTQSIVVDPSFIREGYVLMGDILVPIPDPDAEGTASVYTGGGVWPTNGIIPYEYDASVTASQQAALVDAMNELEALIGVNFVPRSSLAGWTQGYIRFFNVNDPNFSGGFADLGYQGSTYAVVAISNAWVPIVIMHEIGHALGLYHEQERPDRNNFVQVNYANIHPDAQFNFAIATGEPTVGTYDFASMMHYGTHDFSINGNPTIEPLPAYSQWEDRINGETFSQGDLDTLRYMYPCSLQGCSGNPSNDRIGNATLINTFPYTNTVNARLSTLLWNDPTPSCWWQYSGQSVMNDTVWYKYTPTRNLAVSFNTLGSNYDTGIAVYTGNFPNLTQVACDDDSAGNFLSSLSVNLTGGTTYYIMVGRIDWYVDNDATLVFNATAPAFQPPANDNLLNAKVISAEPYTDTVNVEDATLENNELMPTQCNGLTPQRTIWYRFTVPDTNTYQLSTLGSSFNNTFIGLYSSALAPIYCQWGSQVDYEVLLTAGNQYWIQVGAYTGSYGNLKFNLGASGVLNPPIDTNLLYNGGFTKGVNNDAGWRFYGSIQHAVINGRMQLNFPTAVNGWMRQFRGAFPLQPGLKMGAWVVVSNPTSVEKKFQIMFRDSDLSNNYLCNFTIPANTWNKIYTMNFTTLTEWEIIRLDIRTNEVDTTGLRYDNVNLRYLPGLTISDNLDCISPFDESDNLVQNGDFADAENHWTFLGPINHLVTPTEKMQLANTTPSTGWMTQLLGGGTHIPQANQPYEALLEVRNNSAITRTLQVRFRSSDNAETIICFFNVPATATWITYSMRFKTSMVWNDLELLVRPMESDSVPLFIDNIDVRHKPALTVSATNCSQVADEAPPPPPETELTMTESVGTPNGVSANHPPEIGGNEGGSVCNTLDWFNTANWHGYLPTSEVQFVFDPFPETLLVGNGLAHSDNTFTTVKASLNPTGGNIFDANGDGIADTLYDVLSYNGHGHAVSLQNPPSVYGGNEGGNASAMLIREAVIAMLNDRYDSNHPESWWAVEIDTAEALAQGDNAMLALAQRYATSNASCQ